MNRIEKLIAERCQDGVPRIPLSEVAEFKAGKSLKKEDRLPGPYRVVSASTANAATHIVANFPGDVLTVATHGLAGYVSYWDSPIFLSNNVILLQFNRSVVPRFAFFVLSSCNRQIAKMVREGGVPFLDVSAFKRMLIPVPPIEIQREIVDILDSFTRLEAELEAELEARKAQYSFLRNMLLNFEFSAKNVSVNLLGEERFDVQEKRLGDIALIKTGRKLEGAFSGGLLPYVNGGVEPSGWVSCANNPGMVITIPSRGSVGIVGFQWDQFWLGPLCYAVAPKEGIDPRFLYHQLKRQQARLVALQQTGSIPALNKKELVGFVIDVPPLEVQRRIADVLDDFDELVNDLSSGLPAEIAARRQQYEYYRDRLLTFPEKK